MLTRSKADIFCKRSMDLSTVSLCSFFKASDTSSFFCGDSDTRTDDSSPCCSSSFFSSSSCFTKTSCKNLIVTSLAFKRSAGVKRPPRFTSVLYTSCRPFSYCATSTAKSLAMVFAREREVCVLRVPRVKFHRALACVFGKWYEGFCEATLRCTAVAALRSNSKRELLLKSCGATINPN